MKFKKTTLKNGLTVVTSPIPDSLSATVLVMVKAGSKYETKEISGLSHFLEHMCFKGTVKRPTAGDISREIDGLGAQNNAFTSQEFTGYYAKAHPKHISKILDIVSDLYLNPVFDAKEIEKEKGVIVEEINMYEDMPHYKVQDVFSSVLYGDQPAGWNVAGTRETVRSMTRDHFIAYRKKNYVASATTVFISGNFNEKQVISEVSRLFAGIAVAKKQSKKKVIETQVKPNMGICKRETDQTHIVLGVKTYPAKSEKNYALQVLSTILGGGMSSRLFQKLREEMGVGYYVRSSVSQQTDCGVLAVSTGVDKGRVDEVISAVLSEMKKLRDEMVSVEEMKKAQEYILGNMYMGLETSDALAEYYAIQDILDGDMLSPDEYAKKIGQVTPRDIKKVAREIMRDSKLNIAVVGNIVDEKSLEKIFHF